MATKNENSEKEVNGHVSIKVDQPEVIKGPRWFHNFALEALSDGGMVILMITLVVFVIVLLMKHEALRSQQESNSSAVDAIRDSNVTVMLEPKLNVIFRKDWFAQPAIKEAKSLRLPIPYVFIMETGQENCADQAACTLNVRFLQSFHIDSKGWDDIGYNFLVGGDGFAYEGRGWNSQGVHTYGYNSNSIGIAFIGSFNLTMPPERQITATKQLINIGLEKGYINPRFKLLATGQVSSTKTPGLALYEDLKKWLHWTEQP